MRKAKNHHRKEMIVRVLAAVLALLLLGSVLISALPVLAEEEAPINHYALDMTVDLDAQTVRVSQRLGYVNGSGQSLDCVMFHLYANVLRRQEAIPLESGEWDDAFSEGYAPRGVDFISVRVDGQAAEWAVSGAYEQYLRVPCALEPGGTAVIEFEYYLLLPAANLMMGVGDLGWRLTNFYPVAAVYDETTRDFALNNWSLAVDPLMSDVADYEATIRLDETYLLAATGTQTASEPDENGLVTWRVSAPKARDLALVFSRKMNAHSRVTESGVTIAAYASTDSTAQAMLSAAVEAMDVFSAWFGDYPYDELELIETDYLRSGLSKPGVLQLSKSLSGLTRRAQLEETIVRLCASQFFGAVVGNNPNAPWLNDALSAYAALMYYEEKEGYDAYLKRLNAQVLSSLQITIPGGMTVDSAADRFTSLSEYDIIVVDRGCAVLHELRELMGEELFIQSLARYVADNRFNIASVQRLATAMDDVTGARWDEYLVGQLHNISDYVDQSLTWFE